MASPLASIKKGILQGTWKDVVLGYTQMTGEEISAPDPYQPNIVPYCKALVQIRDLASQAIGKSTDDEEHDDVVPLPPPVVHPQSETPVTTPDEDDEEEEEDEQLAPLERPPKRRSALDFSIQHAGTKDGDKRTCKVLPFEKSGIKNNFIDDLQKAKNDIELDKKLTHNVEPTERRPPTKPVKVTCARCGKIEKVHPALVPPKLDKEDQRPNYICNGCVRKGGRE